MVGDQFEVVVYLYNIVKHVHSSAYNQLLITTRINVGFDNRIEVKQILIFGSETTSHFFVQFVFFNSCFHDSSSIYSVRGYSYLSIM